MAKNSYPMFSKLCSSYGLSTPVCEHSFWPGRRFAFDFAWPDHLIAVEIEGGLFLKGGGRHNRGASMKNDMVKYNEAAVRGWIVLRITPDQIMKEETYELLKRAFRLSADAD